MATMSAVRMRVAKSDWCASRSVVSVTRTRGSSRIQRANAVGPSSRRRSRDPAGSGTSGSATGRRGRTWVRSGTVRPFMSGWPLTVTSPRKCSRRVARSRRRARLNSVGVESMKRVVTLPAPKSGWLMTFSTNCRLVATPRIRNSRKARSIRRIASPAVGAHAVTFTSSES
jgi:hypothetical protein